MKKYLSSYPELVKEWHPTKNGNLTPEQVTFGSDKKVWWKCSKEQSHEWKAQIKNRMVAEEGLEPPTRGL